MDSLGPRGYDFIKGFNPTWSDTRYMNIGFRESPYPGKKGQGDYGPTQGGDVYYWPYNPNYPYPMDTSYRNPSYTFNVAQDIPEYVRRAELPNIFPKGYSGPCGPMQRYAPSVETWK